MTREEFDLLVEQLKDEDGKYDDKAMYQLGVAMKSIPNKGERNWAELAEIVGYHGGANSFRNWVNTRMKRDGILPKSVQYPSDDSSILAQELFKERIELEKEKQKVRDERTAYRRLIREDAREDEFRNSMVEAASVLEGLPKVEYVGELPRGDKEAILMLSDMHIGVNCDNFYNKYNKEIARERLNVLLSDVISYCKTFGITTLNVCNLGDMVHGIIHTNARIECELDVIEQVIVASEYISEFLNGLLQAAPRVVYRSVIDNHSRVIANKADALDSEHFSKLIDWFLQERLKHTSVIFANDNLDDGVGKFDLINGKSVMFAHGHNDSINSVYQNFTGMTKSYIDVILLGHYHSPKEKSFQDTKVFVNGSIVGTEQYAFSKRLFSRPSQTLIIFDGDNVLNITVELDR